MERTMGQQDDFPRLPEAFLRRVEGQLGAELPDFLRACGENALRGIRINPLKKFAGLPVSELEGAISWCEGAWYLGEGSAAGTTVEHEAGAFYIQEPSAMTPAAVMEAKPGEKILDLCAAPGGKSTQMGAAMRGSGLLVCNEPVIKRAKILEAAAKLVRPGGRLVYSTCTFNPAENEEQVKAFLHRHSDFYPEGFSLPGAEGREGMLTCWPHRMKGEGQFIAKLRREESAESQPAMEETFVKLSGEETRAIKDTVPGMPEPTGRLGHILFYLPGAPEVSGLQVLRMGLHIGEIRERRFIPDHASALCAFPPEASVTVLSEEEALRYMAGESIAGEAKGWTLMSWKGLILGWGKGSEGRIRNHYPKGLRNGRMEIGEVEAHDPKHRF